MGPDKNQHPSRTVEEPPRGILVYLIVAVVAAFVVWSILPSQWPDLGIDEQSAHRTRTESPETPRRGKANENVRGDARGDLRTLFSADDYPAAAAANNEQGIVQAVLSVDTHGAVSACRITRSSGYARLDNATCNILQRRARFTPARDVDGKAVPDEVTTPPVVWRLEG